VHPSIDEVFRALADPTRRRLLDRLHDRNGQTLGELCDGLGMARQSATQHLSVLEAANLIATARRGREKLHYLNPVPLHAIQERWIDKFERPRLRDLAALKRKAEDDMTDSSTTGRPTTDSPTTGSSTTGRPTTDRPTFVYVTYIEATPERVWYALTDAELTARYWGHSNVSDWQAGSPWEHQRTDGSGTADVVGTIVESDPPRRLVFTWAGPGEDRAGGPGVVTFDIEPYGDIVRLTATHENLADDAERDAAAAGWAAVLANLKSLLETGHPLPQAPWTMSRS
jgi:uncharacterized protein YndB with AHSA1/START domain/DNA-binding transcriptional ArsR family regulator